MADRTIKILTAATDFDLITLDELKVSMGIPTTDTSHDEQFQLWIDQYSAVIARTCNRTFAYEKVQETWRGDPPPYERNRLFLSHWPIKLDDLESIEAPAGTPLDLSTYAFELEEQSGKLSLFGSWDEDIVVTYSGGYVLPDEAPDDLKAAMSLALQAARFHYTSIGASGIRSISHRESRVQFFDLTSLAKISGGLGPLSQINSALDVLLYKYMRIEV